MVRKNVINAKGVRESARTEALRAQDLAHVWHPYTQMSDYASDPTTPIVERGEGAYVIDTEGRRYLDGYAQMWCNVFGHCDPDVNKGIKEQLDRIAHSSLFSASSVPAIELATEISKLAAEEYGQDDSPLPHVFFSDNGSTAIEVALKIALQYQVNIGEKQRTRFLCFSDAYHGDTGTTLTLGGVELFRKTFEPITFEVLRTNYPICAQPERGPSPDEEEAYHVARTNLEATFAKHGHEMAAVVIEPGCQGAGGIRPLHPGYLQALRELCDQHGVLLIADEILVAFGRCGAIFNTASEGVVPDLLCLGKGLTAGYLPLALTLATSKIFDAFSGVRSDFRHLMHGHTFTGNQLGCAAALTTLRLFKERKLIEHIASLQPLIRERIERLEQLPDVMNVRHLGMMVGIEIDTKSEDGYASSAGQQICAHALSRGTIIRSLGNVAVLMPVLASTASEMEKLFDDFEWALMQQGA